MRGFRCLLICFVISIILIPNSVESHSADTFTVVIKEEGLTPSSSHLLYNDSVVWYNTDSRENITHRIVYDADGDGLYNGTLDWDSGLLYSECSIEDENNSEECNINFQILFNGTWGIGEYSYQDILSNGTTYTGTITVIHDTHPDESLPILGDSYGVFEENTEEEDKSQNQVDVDKSKKFLFILGIISGIGALLLLILLIIRMKL